MPKLEKRLEIISRHTLLFFANRYPLKKLILLFPKMRIQQPHLAKLAMHIALRPASGPLDSCSS